MFAQEATLIFAESEKNILICGEPLSQKDQERPQATALLEMLLNFGIKSITFEKGLDKTELTAFLEIMGRKPENVKNEGLSQVLAEKTCPISFWIKKSMWPEIRISKSGQS